MNPPNSGQGAATDGATEGATSGASDRANEADDELQLSGAGEYVPYPKGGPQRLSWATYALCYGWPDEGGINKAIGRARARAHELLDLFSAIDYFNTNQGEFAQLQVQGPPGPPGGPEIVFEATLKKLLSIETLHCVGGIRWSIAGGPIIQSRVKDGSEWILYANVPLIATSKLREIYQRYWEVLKRCKSARAKQFTALVEGCLSESTENRSPHSRPAWLLNSSMKDTGDWVKLRSSAGKPCCILWNKLFPHLLFSTFLGSKTMWEATKRVLGPEAIAEFHRCYKDLTENPPPLTEESFNYIPNAVDLFKCITELSLPWLFRLEAGEVTQPELT